MFVIEDERHAELQKGEYSTLAGAIAELKRRAALPWNEPPNVAPCSNWERCGRSYEIVEYDTSVSHWRALRRLPVLEISATGIEWHALSQQIV
jgi:hypothetical protein